MGNVVHQRRCLDGKLDDLLDQPLAPEGLVVESAIGAQAACGKVITRQRGHRDARHHLCAMQRTVDAFASEWVVISRGVPNQQEMRVRELAGMDGEAADGERAPLDAEMIEAVAQAWECAQCRQKELLWLACQPPSVALLIHDHRHIAERVMVAWLHRRDPDIASYRDVHLAVFLQTSDPAYVRD